MFPIATKSSLEIMLDTIRLREEQPKDAPPALPARPTSRGRLPSSRKPPPASLKLEVGSPKSLVVEPARKQARIEVQNTPTKGDNEEMNEELPQVHSAVLAELQTKVLKAEAALQERGEENAILLQQLQQYEMRWSENEAKMKSMEETWQEQLTSLQLSLAEAKRSLASDKMDSHPGRLDASPVHNDSDDMMSVGARMPEGTPPNNQIHPFGARMHSNGPQSAVNILIKEFDQQKHVFEDGAGFLVAVKSGQAGSNVNQYEELRKLKQRFAAWKKDYKARLREAKAALQKFGDHEEKRHIRWWAKKWK